MKTYKNSEENFQKYWKDGMTHYQYAKLINCQVDKVIKWIRKYHPEVKLPVGLMYPYERSNSEENFKKYWKDGMTVKEYAKCIKSNVHNASKWIRTYHPEVNLPIQIFNSENLFKKYWKPGMTIKQYSDIVGINYSSVFGWIKRNHPELTRSINDIPKNSEELFQKYWVDGMTIDQYAKLINLTYTSARKWIRKYHPEVKTNDFKNSEENFQKYWRTDMTVKEYAEIIGCSEGRVSEWIKMHHPEVRIPKRKRRLKDRNSEIPEKFKSFWTKDMTIEKFAKICRISYNAMQQWLYQNHPEVLFKHVFKRTEQHV